MNPIDTQPTVPRIVLTTGEPAGIGPDVILMAAQKSWDADLLCIGDLDMLKARSGQLGLDIEFLPHTSGNTPRAHQPGQLRYVHVPAPAPVVAGQLQVENAFYVLATLSLAAELCRSGEAEALVTAPVQKSIINDAGIPFTGHTEFLAEAFNCPRVVMLLVAGDFRVALATTHLPLSQVAAALTTDSLVETLRILDHDLKTRFEIESPQISVLGLNPHAGEGGHLGHEEVDIIRPAIEKLRQEGHQLTDPLPADTAFTADWRARTDAYLAMYHDQGLPVLKSAGFGEAVNITLGLPVIRTSVDHGTALALAGTGLAKPGSLEAAIQTAMRGCQRAQTQEKTPAQLPNTHNS